MAKRSAVRNFLMHGFHLLVLMVVGNQIRDTQCGFKVTTHLLDYLFGLFRQAYAKATHH